MQSRLGDSRSMFDGLENDIDIDRNRHAWFLKTKGKSRSRVRLTSTLMFPNNTYLNNPMPLTPDDAAIVLYAHNFTSTSQRQLNAEDITDVFDGFTLILSHGVRESSHFFRGMYHAYGALILFADTVSEIETHLNWLNTQFIRKRSPLFIYEGGIIFYFSAFTPVYLLCLVKQDEFNSIFQDKDRVDGFAEFGKMLDDNSHVVSPRIETMYTRIPQAIFRGVQRLLLRTDLPPEYTLVHENPPPISAEDNFFFDKSFSRKRLTVEDIHIPYEMNRFIQNPQFVVIHTIQDDDTLRKVIEKIKMTHRSLLRLGVFYKERSFDLQVYDGFFTDNSVLVLMMKTFEEAHAALCYLKQWRIDSAIKRKKSYEESRICIQRLGYKIHFHKDTAVFLLVSGNLNHGDMKELSKVESSLEITQAY